MYVTESYEGNVGKEIETGGIRLTVTKMVNSETKTCGDNCRWGMYDSILLYISGSGNMTDWSYSSYSPWYSHRQRIKTIYIEMDARCLYNF